MSKKRKPRKEAQLIVAGFTATFVILCILFVIFLISKSSGKFGISQNEPIHETVSLSEEAAANAYIWLNRIDDMPLSYREIKTIMGDISLTLILTPTAEKGIYIRSLEDGSYEACLTQAQNGFADAYREVIRYRLYSAACEDRFSENISNNNILEEAYFAEEITDEMLDQIMYEAYGVSIAEYLQSRQVSLLPPVDELTGLYAGEVAYE